MLQKHVFAFFARVQLCISSFACKLLCRHSSLIAEVNSCINFIFLRGPIRRTQVSTRTKFIFAVVKYQRLRGASQYQAFSKMDQWL